MKVDDPILQNILKAYGSELKPQKSKNRPAHEGTLPADPTGKKINSDDLDIINYDKDGNITLNNQKKDALIDFFQ